MAISDGIRQLHSTFRGMAVLVILAILADPALAIVSDNTHSFTWVLVLAFFAAFAAAYGIGANDVANSFSTSVGAKSLTVFQAVCLASIFEFLGAVLLGSQVSETVRKGIADSECFEGNPGLLMWGMTCVLILTAFWLILASYLEMPVSTTHSTIGGIIGMTMMVRGSECILWNERTDTFPYVSGVSAVITSWLLSPLCSGVVAAIIYGITYYTVLKDHETSFERTKYAFPMIVAFTVAINVGFFVLKGASGKKDDFGTEEIVDNAKNGDGHMIALVVGLSAVISFGAMILAMPLLLHKIETKVNMWDQIQTYLGYTVVPVSEKSVELTVTNDTESPAITGEESDDTKKNKDNTTSTMDNDTKDTTEQSTSTRIMNMFSTQANSMYESVKRDITTNVDDVISKGAATTELHSNVLRHDERTEEMFKYVQVFTAIVDSFSHGANDIANAMGPFAAIWITYEKNMVPSEKEDIGDSMYWILVFGGVGLVLGMATYGYKIMSAMGVKLVAVTPSRGFAIELGAAFVVLYGSTQGWPLSTTHCQVGATVGVGLFEGVKGVDKTILLKTCLGWVLTLLVCALGAALLVGPNPEAPTT